MKTSELLKYYNQDEILDEILRVCKNREVVAKFGQGFFGARPSTILYKKDLLDLIRRGAVSFHISVERWRNPLSLNQTNTKKDMDDLRTGWDLVLDIDTKILDYAKICAKLLIMALEFHNIKNYSIKYSGGSGFHIGVAYESFPDNINGVETKTLFPEAAQWIASYLSEMIKEKLAENILIINSLEAISERTSKPADELLEDGKFNPYSVIEIDTIAISPRHLIRMPYSVNEKREIVRVSLPITKKELEDFDPDTAVIDKAEFNQRFLDGSKSMPNEAKELFVQAFDWHNKTIENMERLEQQKKKTNYSTGTYTKSFYKIPEEDYPPCIKIILKGLEDGKKRALFILINYFKSANYTPEEIENIITEWNKKNKEPLREQYIKAQLSWINKRQGEYLPPNCNSLMYYSDLGICKKDEICEEIKNPLNYSYKHYKRTKHSRQS
ncbi:MAG: hypothetical protein JW791_05185 [Nanoarchaeota archaeon]|nr:hypothetical protein [Nanoarchaeota archaeon]